MVDRVRVRPARTGMGLSHPAELGVLSDEGGTWPSDQFTFRRLRDRDIERVEDEPTATLQAAALQPAEPTHEAP